MFNNLIESSSHAQEFKRRGSFLLFTTATYLVLFVITGVASIYAYDAHLESQTTELEVLNWVPEPPPEAVPEVPRNPVTPASPSDDPPTQSERTKLIDSTSNPNNMPDNIFTGKVDIPPANPNSVISYRNAEPIGPAYSGRGTPGGTGDKPVIDIPDNPPPPVPKPTPVTPKIIKVSTILNGNAISLPKPKYPEIAKLTRTQGTVSVQILIDETGKVVSAKAVSGPPFLIPEAQKAAMQARFSPTVVGEQPVKVSGVITYNFVLN